MKIFLLIIAFSAFAFSKNCETPTTETGQVHGTHTEDFERVFTAMTYLCDGQLVPGYPFDFGQTSMVPFVGGVSVYYDTCNEVKLYCGKQKFNFTSFSAYGPDIDETTLFPIFSGNKHVVALLYTIAESRGYFDWEDKVSQYLDLFLSGGKENITFTQFKSNGACLSTLDPIDLSEILLDGNYTRVRELIRNSIPECTPGTSWGYVPVIGGIEDYFVLNAILESHSYTFESFFAEISATVGTGEFFFGIPLSDTTTTARVADLRPGVFPFVNSTESQLLNAALANPSSIAFRALFNPIEFLTIGPLIFNFYRNILLLSGSGFATPDWVAKFTHHFVTKNGKFNGVRLAKTSAITCATENVFNGTDANRFKQAAFSRAGFFQNTADYVISPNNEAFGHDGAGTTSQIVGDRDNRLSAAIFTPNYNTGTNEHSLAYQTRVLNAEIWKARCDVCQCEKDWNESDMKRNALRK
jgi:hypothetical protein